MTEPHKASGILALVPALASIPGATRPYSPEEQAAEDARYRREVWLAQQHGGRAGRLMQAGAPEEMADLIARGEVQQTKAVEYVHRWLAGKRRLLFLAGKKDASKTAAASVAVDEAMTRWLSEGGNPDAGPRLVPVEFLANAWRYFDKTKKGLEPFDPATRTNKAQMLRCPFLAFDDVGQEGVHDVDTVGEAIEVLSYRRPEAGLWMLITTNCEEMGKRGADGRYHPESSFLARYPGRAQRLERTIRQFGIWTRCPTVHLRPAEHTVWDR